MKVAILKGKISILFLFQIIIINISYHCALENTNVGLSIESHAVLIKNKEEKLRKLNQEKLKEIQNLKLREKEINKLHKEINNMKQIMHGGVKNLSNTDIDGKLDLKEVIVSKNNAKYIFLSLSLLIFICFLIFKESISQYFITLFSMKKEDLNIDETNIDNILNNSKVHNFLFKDEFGYFKQKYGTKFNLENSDMILIKNEILEISLYTGTGKCNSAQLKEIIYDSILTDSQLKAYLIVSTIHGMIFLFLFFLLYLLIL
jgi:hypothetical protein